MIWTWEPLEVAIREHYRTWFTARELVEDIPQELLPISVQWRMEDGVASAAITMGMFLRESPRVRSVRVRGRRAWKLTEV